MTQPRGMISSLEIREDPHEFTKKMRVFFFHRDESILDNLANRHERPTEVYKDFIEIVRRAAGLDDRVKFKWSQKAGCQCGCSPGFICDAPEMVGNTVFVTLKGAPTYQ